MSSKSIEDSVKTTPKDQRLRPKTGPSNTKRKGEITPQKMYLENIGKYHFVLGNWIAGFRGKVDGNEQQRLVFQV